MKNTMFKVIIICFLISLVLLSCRKNISDFHPGMTKQEVSEAWGDKAIKTFTIINNRPFDIWQYNFRANHCYLVFENDRLILTHVQQKPDSNFWLNVWLQNRSRNIIIYRNR